MGGFPSGKIIFFLKWERPLKVDSILSALFILAYCEEALVIFVKNSKGIANLSLVPGRSENLKCKIQIKSIVTFIFIFDI